MSRIPDLKKGYKQSEVGLIPEDWEAQKIGDHAVVTKLAGFEYTLYFDYSKSGPITAIRALNIKNGTLNLEDIHTIPKETSNALPRSKLKKGDLVMSYVGTLGRVAVIQQDDRFHLAPNVAKLTVNRESVSPEFLSHYLNSFFGQKSIFEAAASTTQAALSMRNLRCILFVRPTKAEQEAIAEALSDADALIESLEQLIAKKRQIKQGAMQELLTGKKRLPGFKKKPGYKKTEVGVIPEDWEVVIADDVCFKIQDGTHFSPKVRGNDYLYITSKNIRFGFLDISSASRIDAEQHRSIYNRCDVKPGDLLLTKDGANTGNAALNILNEEFSLLSSVAFLRFYSSEHVAGYFLQQILSSQGQRQIQDAMSGNAITRLTLDKIKKLYFPVPSTKSEQEAIAAILSDMDAELEALETKLEKARQIKQGMMQALLTGRIRLV